MTGVQTCALPIYAAEDSSQHETVKVGFFAMDGYHVMDEEGNRSGYGYDLRRFTKGYYIKQPNMDCQPTEFTALSRHRAVFSWAGKGGIPICGA